MSQVKISTADNRTLLGFWIYLMTDCVLFGSLFATYAVLHQNTFGGPSGQDLFELPYVLVETLLLLTSSFTAGVAILAAKAGRKKQVIGWLVATLLLGLSFLVMEIVEFQEILSSGYSWETSGFLSSFFTLVATHGAHITIGLIWIGVMVWRVWKLGITQGNLRRLMIFSLFWHFLDVVWIFIFTIVYLMGVIGI
ncbi:MAG: cytochrome o ubiquinol oxidase subunit III [bacterium]|nr:cytochrome o ubiquinol oxidase subunit III [bacterium]